ncbi:sigma-70 family RNA polymerase sigma factor [Sulfitobacter sp. JBTF-M27]|uniref:Sigma-70 family RNA polymerase sigma factor n=1 Tax=Sulfitobacter sediminilitoris TaxID=2698830 RepID=A0A6P0CH67_9RHOB|nr:sigma-70 family RNA polymerase sigma factor [Sulfitobacter sediminilitoris]NEK23813.1 sigma-70 family RNA polymerase sigma factor [Sulfitobacter sediminilitoris]
MTYSYAAARSAPLLEWEDERLLIENWQLRQDANALEALVLSHARIVHYWARKLSRDKVEQEELVSEGIIGLIRAADLFDVTREVRFSTYARWWVKNSVLTALDRLRSVVETPANARKSAPQQINRSIDDEDNFEGLVSDDPTPEEHMIAKSSRDAMRRRITDAMTGLNDIDREVLTCRSLKQPPDTISDLANRLGMNTSKLRQLERRAMARLKYELIARGVMTSRV